MPELPEVESLVRGIRSELVGKSFADVVFYRDDIREKIPKIRLKQILVDQKIKQVFRRGKYLLVGTDHGFLGVHLGMSGRLVKAANHEKLPAHTHAVFEISPSVQFRFVDPRRFGRLFSIENHELYTHPFLAKLGIEPLENVQTLACHLYQKSRGRMQPIKNFIMDSSVVVGVGNIYASEALWLARIHPEQKSRSLSEEDYLELAHAISEVLIKAIAAGGTTFRDYRDKDGKPGYFQNKLAVYGKNTKPCPRCMRKICRAVHCGRSTFYCSFCQNKKKARTVKNSRQVKAPHKNYKKILKILLKL